MKILFLHPPWPGKGYGLRSQNRWPRKRGDKTNRYPILLCYVATLLKKEGYEVKYIDSVYQDLNYELTFQEIDQYQPDILLIETATSAYLHDKFFINKLKEKNPKMKILLAGSHVTKFPVKSLIECKADIIIKGEMDLTTLNTINAIKNKKSLKNIKGICYKEKNRIINNPNAPLIKNLDPLPFPDRDLIPHRWYVEGHVKRTPFTFVMGARGCPNNCTFCLWPNVYYNHKVRFRSPKNIVDEIEWLIRKYNMKEIFFDEGTFNTSKKRVIDICKEIISRNIKILWGCSCRVDELNKEMLDWMKKAGCKVICYGIESPNPETLKRTNKGITREQSINAIKLTKKAKITAHANLMIGFPWETKQDIKETIRFGLRLKPDTIQFSLVFPHPGSEMYEKAIEKKWFYEDALTNYNRFDMTSGPILKTGMEKRELSNIISKAHTKFFLRPTYIISQITKIRTYEDVKMLTRGARSVIKGKILFKK